MRNNTSPETLLNKVTFDILKKELKKEKLNL